MNQANSFRVLLCVLAAASAFAATPARAQTYPTRPVRVILPFAAGGIADITTRVVAERLGDRLGQRVIVDNQPGAGGIAAARSVLASPADGYTLALVTNGTAISVPLFKTLPFDPVRDFVPISALGNFDLAMTVNAASPYRTLGDFLKEAKASPGKLNVGTISVGSTQNLAAELLRSLSGDSFTLITYRTAPEAVIALLRDDIQLLVEYYATVKSGLEDGKLRVIATSGDKRSQMLPNVPTVAQAGVPGYAVTSWNALFAPAGTPPAVIAKINADTNKILADADMKERATKLGFRLVGGTSEALGAHLRSEIDKWAKVAKAAGLEPK
jgi:tripartite-type tricarboxylate transporter receptor subunit TctC